MGRRSVPTTSDPRPGRRTAGRFLGLAAALCLALAVAPGAAGAQDDTPGAPTLGGVMDGDVAGLTATATSDFGGRAAADMQVVVDLVNDTDAPATVAVPFGTLLATDDEADQTVAIGGPIDDPTLAQVARSGGTPTLEAPPGSSSHTLVAYCTEADDSAPDEPTPLRHLGPAEEPLPTVLREIAVQQPSPEVAQDAVWWVTDDATLPVPAALAPLLTDVDTEAFAADPHRVVPDTGYAPRWARAGILDEAFDGGGSGGGDSGSAGPGSFLWVLAAIVAVIGAVVITSRAGRDTPTPVVATPAPGWYRDPWVPTQQRWWDGSTWTGRVQGPR